MDEITTKGLDELLADSMEEFWGNVDDAILELEADKEKMKQGLKYLKGEENAKRNAS